MFCNLNTLKSLVCSVHWHVFGGSSPTLSPKPDNYYKNPLAPIMLSVYLWTSMIQKKSWALARVQYATIIDDHRRIYSVNELIMTLISMEWCNFNDMSVATLSCTPVLSQELGEVRADGWTRRTFLDSYIEDCWLHLLECMCTSFWYVIRCINLVCSKIFLLLKQHPDAI